MLLNCSRIVGSEDSTPTQPFAQVIIKISITHSIVRLSCRFRASMCLQHVSDAFFFSQQPVARRFADSPICRRSVLAANDVLLSLQVGIPSTSCIDNHQNIDQPLRCLRCRYRVSMCASSTFLTRFSFFQRPVDTAGSELQKMCGVLASGGNHQVLHVGKGVNALLSM